MEMKNNRGFLLIILILGGLVSFSQLKRFNSSKQQYEMQFDLEQDRFSRPINFVEKIETNYPNLTYLGVPLSACLLYTSPSPRDPSISRMPSSA